MEVGKKYCNTLVGNKPTYECLAITSDGKPIIQWDSGLTGFAAAVVHEDALKYYKEYIEPKRVYVSVWKNKAHYVWTIAEVDKTVYAKLSGLYVKFGYIKLAEYTLEYNDEST